MVMEEANCPCSDMGSGTGLGQAGPLTELCDVCDVVVLVLAGTFVRCAWASAALSIRLMGSGLYGAARATDADAEGKMLALAVVDGDDEATLLCLRDAESRSVTD